MATYKGRFTIPYDGGKFLIPVYELTSEEAQSGSSVRIDPYSEGSVIMVADGSAPLKYTEEIYINSEFKFGATDLSGSSGNRTGGRPAIKRRDNNTVVAYLGLSAYYSHYDLPYSVIGVYEDNYYSLFSSFSNYHDTNIYNCSVVNPSVGSMGYYVISPVSQSTTYFTVIKWGISDTDFIDFLKNNLEPVDTDPYANAGNSDVGGGGGSWDDGSDPVGIPNLPSVGATNTGFISLFVPSQSQLKSVAEYMWGGLFDLSTWKRLFEDPMDCILGLSVVPVSVPTSGSANITVGNIELSGISLPVASQQYVEVDCGSLTVSPYFGSYLDYEPYTKMSLFVPYSGVHTVNADDIMGKTVNLVYHIDILTGSLVAFLKCGDSVLYEFNGACSSNIPVNSMNYASTIENAIRIATNIGTTVATAGASAPLSAGTEATKKAQNVARGISLAGSTADGALSLKPNIDRAGSLGGTTGLLGNQTPYFIVTRPRLCKPKDQNKIKGYPAFINYSVSDLVGKGYTEFDTILLKNLYLTDDEKNELESILMGGVYL